MKDSGFSWIELLLTVALVALVASIAVPTVQKDLRYAKRAEPFESLMKIGTGAAVYYYTRHVGPAGSTLPNQFPSGDAESPAKQCCSYPGGRCPASQDLWDRPTWRALDFRREGDHEYRYTYGAGGQDCNAGFLVFGEGDLDCDGTFSLWRLHGTTVNTSCIVQISPVFSFQGGELGGHAHKGPHGEETE